MLGPLTEVVAFVEKNQAIAAQFGQPLSGLRDGQDLAVQTVARAIVFPHGNEVARAQNQRFQIAIVFKDASERGGHERFAQADHVADEDAAAFIEVMGGDLNCLDLKLEKFIAEIARDTKLGDPRQRLLG